MVWRAGILVLAVTAAGCRDRDCAALARAARHREAVAVCLARHDRQGDAAAGLDAARSLLALGERARALALAPRLYDSPVGAAARRLVGQVYLADDRFDLAKPLLERALEQHRAAGQDAGAHAAAAALVTGYWIANDFDRALPTAELARSLAAKLGDPLVEAKALVALGAVLHSAGDLPRATQAYRDAGARLPPAARRERADLLVRRAVIFSDERQGALARPLLAEARELAVEVADRELELAAEVNLASLALGARELASAEAHLARAEVAAAARGRDRPSPGVLLNRALLARLRGQWDASLAALDEVAKTEPPPEVTWILAHERGLVARDRGQLDLADARYREAIAIVEQMWRELGPETLRAPFFEDRWQPYSSLFALRLSRGDASGAFAVVVAAQGRMFLAEALEAAVAVSGRRPALRGFGAQIAQSPLADSPGAAQTLAALRDRYVLDYFSDGESLRLLVLDRGVVRAAPLAVPLRELDRLIDAFWASPDDPASARALGDALLPPEVLARAPRRLVVVPYGAAVRVPFAALRTEAGRVIERHEIAYAPSAAALAARAAHGAGAAPPAGQGGVLLGDTRGGLTQVAAELAAIAELTGARAHLDAAASIAALRSGADAPFLHVAGHSGASADGVYLVLADGQVSADDILRWRLRPRVAVLASCASAASARRELWGSLAVAFLAAGSEQVVATLHSVRDEVAAAFTVAFYRAGGARDPVAAVRAAQLALAASYSAADWAAFAVLGL